MNKFVKLMMLTTSANDHEALSALRKANAILADQSVSWEQLINGLKNLTVQVEVVKQEEPKKGKKKEEKIAEMFEAVLKDMRDGSAKEFILDINRFFTEKGFLTDKQQAALEKFYKNVRKE